jgi:hypothetical protein
MGRPPLIPPPGTQSPISLAIGPLQGFWLPPWKTPGGGAGACWHIPVEGSQ